MGLFDFFRRYKTISIKQNLFRREVETSHFTGKEFDLPKYKEFTAETAVKQRDKCLLRFYDSMAEYQKSAEMALEITGKERTIAKAEKIISNYYNIFNDEIIQTEEKINWNKDYKSGHEFADDLAWRLELETTPQGVDVTRVHYLSRFYFATDLALAYMITNDDKYADKFVSVLLDYIENVKFCCGVTWSNLSDVSIRLVNILFALPLFYPSDKITAEVLTKIRKLTLQHCAFIEGNIDDSKEKNAYIFTSSLGLLQAGLFLIESDYGKRIATTGIRNIERKIRELVKPDGVSYEQSLAGHMLAIRSLTVAAFMINRWGKTFSKDFYKILHNMFNTFKAYQRDDYSLPNLGDPVPGRVLNLPDRTEISARALLALGAYLFEDGELKSIASGGEVSLILLMGPKAVEEFNAITPERYIRKSMAFKNGGHFIICDYDLHLFIKAAEIGHDGKFLNTHIDTFSYELYYKGKPFLIDPGMHAFFGDKEKSMKLRTVNYHNTFSIDNMQLVSLEDGKIIKTDLTKPKLVEWHDTNDEVVFSANHFAYINLPDPVICTRTIIYNKYTKVISVNDEFIGNEHHRVSCNIPLHPDVKIETKELGEYALTNDGVSINVKFFVPEDEYQSIIQDSFYSPHYGELQEAKKLNLSFVGKFPLLYSTEIHLK